MKRARPILALAALGMLAAAWLGCATVPACPSKGGPAWTELTSAHFVVRTDLRTTDAEDLVRALEETRASLLTVVWPKAPDPPGRTEVIAFESDRELSAYVPTFTRGMRVHAPPFSPVLVIGPLRGREQLGVVAHELTHELARHFLPLQPSWYSEGIATFVESLSYSRLTGKVRIGDPPALRLIDVHNRRPTLAETLVSAGEVPAGLDGGWFESSSWLLFHYLVDNHLDALALYQNLVRALTPGVDAWTRAFPGLTFDRLDRELINYRDVNQYKVVERPVQVPPFTVGKRALQDVEVHALRAFLLVTAVESTTSPDEAREELDEVFRQEPENLAGLSASFYRSRDKAMDLALARRAIAAHPKSWLAAVMLADALDPTDPAGHAALVHALIETPRSAELTIRLARWEAAVGNWEAARQFADQALHLGVARSVRNLLLFAEALARTASCEEAAFVMDRAARNAPKAGAPDVDAGWRAVMSACPSVRRSP
jgi:hypothetical protein